MKKLSLSILALTAVFFMGCKDETGTTPVKGESGSSIEVSEANFALYTKITATWCPPCGGWGWDLSKEINTEIEGNGIGLGVYGSNTSKMTNTTAQALTTDIGISGYPNFALNGVNETATSETGGIFTAQTKTNVVDAATAFASAPVEMGIGGKLTWEDSKLNIDLSVKAFKDQSGEYTVAAYIVEDDVLEEQASQTGMVEHHNVLRGSANGETYGTEFSGALTAGTQTDMETMDYGVDPDWNKDNISVVAVIWKKEGSKHTFVNCVHIK